MVNFLQRLGSLSAGVKNTPEYVQQLHVNDALQNYGTDPAGSINAVRKYNPAAAMELQQVQQAQQEHTQAQQAEALGKFADAAYAAHQGGGDLSQTLEGLRGFAKQAFGLDDTTYNGYAQQILKDPTLLQGLSTAAQKATGKTMVVGPGAHVVDANGVARFDAPFAPQKPLIVPRGDGGRDVVDPAALGAGAPVASGAADPFGPLIQQESRGQQFAANGATTTSPKGALGVAQVMPSTGPIAAKYAGLPWDPQRLKTDAAYNEALGRAYHAVQLANFGGDAEKAAAAYNAGPGRVAAAVTKAGANWRSALPAETRDYISKVAPGFAGGGAQPGALYSTPGKPVDKFVPLPPEELKKYPGVLSAQIDTRTGKLANVIRASAGLKGAADPAQAAALAAGVVDGLDGLAALAKKLHDNSNLAGATGGIQGRLPSIFQGSVDFDADVAQLKNNIGLAVLNQMRALSKTGASGLGQLSNREGERLDAALGSLDQKQGTAQFKGKLEEIMDWVNRAKQRIGDATKAPSASVGRAAGGTLHKAADGVIEWRP